MYVGGLLNNVEQHANSVHNNDVDNHVNLATAYFGFEICCDFLFLVGNLWLKTAPLRAIKFIKRIKTNFDCVLKIREGLGLTTCYMVVRQKSFLPYRGRTGDLRNTDLVITTVLCSTN